MGLEGVSRAGGRPCPLELQLGPPQVRLALLLLARRRGVSRGAAKSPWKRRVRPRGRPWLAAPNRVEPGELQPDPEAHRALALRAGRGAHRLRDGSPVAGRLLLPGRAPRKRPERAGRLRLQLR